MASVIGERLRLSLFGESHGAAVGGVLDGFPAGLAVDFDALGAFLARRTPEKGSGRKEPDEPEFLSGIYKGLTCDTPIAFFIRNRDAYSEDYAFLPDLPRPCTADETARIHAAGFNDPRGGGHLSGRLTAPLCVAGGLCLQQLAAYGVAVETSIERMGDAESAKQEGDSVGGIVQCRITGLPAGIGEPIFDSFEGLLAKAMFGIPAVKGISFGLGFAGTGEKGSAYNAAENADGGILGGRSTGQPVLFHVAFKPTPSISQPQNITRVSTGETVSFSIPGRHDACIVPRGAVAVEAAAALTTLDLILRK